MSNLMKRRFSGWLGVPLLAMGLCATVEAAPWFPLGPYGGDARSFAVDPQDSKHLFMGSATGFIYESSDGGASWKRRSMVAKRDDLVLDHIMVDSLNPKHLIVGAWVLDHPDGGLYESNDSGLTWYAQSEMRGQSVRSMAVAPSDPKVIVVGTLKGVYRSDDAGLHWHLISPEGSTEIHEVESIAIDPVDPRIVYAGTWHLPWKTVDGGAHWVNIKKGIIDDSDVFSIIVDPKNPRTVYASACSGIYKSIDAAANFVKIQGIPSTARRTRKLMQDPNNGAIVLAGTTQGLYRTVSSGTDWSRLTGDNVIINDVFIDPKNSNHVLLATDRAGVLASEDGGVSFKPSNAGFSARQVTSFAADGRKPSTIYVGVVNDKDAGGVFVSHDGGVNWQQESNSLGGRDVFSLGTTTDGTLLAGTGHGIFRLSEGLWEPSGNFTVTPRPAPEAVAKPRPVATKGKAGTRAVVKTPVKPALVKEDLTPKVTTLDATVYAIVPSGDALFAGTSQGLVKGTADGHMWTDVPTLEMPETRFLAAEKGIVMAATLRRIGVSVDGGKKWDVATVPAEITQISTIAVDEVGNLWVGGREGAFYSTDYGSTWKTLRNLFVTQVTGIYFDKSEHRVMVTTNGSFNTISFAVHLPDYKVSYWDSGWNLRFVRPAGGHLIGATLYDGVVVEPTMVDSKEKASK